MAQSTIGSMDGTDTAFPDLDTWVEREAPSVVCEGFYEFYDQDHKLGTFDKQGDRPEHLEWSYQSEQKLGVKWLNSRFGPVHAPTEKAFLLINHFEGWAEVVDYKSSVAIFVSFPSRAEKDNMKKEKDKEGEEHVEEQKREKEN
ncbi:uncharacterized protein PAC_15728 [Phialocephala subalpina]|uniref:Uncharacterized protein n=1 Tax=Phialocephala subalpina TaxID=576137 RepID=A0A1L7XLD3_9HELO|nr:uncharacterized protein PAC_15728 [Phialocephala subalpina]